MAGVFVSRCGVVRAYRLTASLPHAAGVAVELGAAKGAALEEVADRVGRQLGLRRKRLLAIVLGPTGWAIAVGMRAAVVPPGALVVGGTVEDLEAQVGVLQADTDEL